ncbi:hypothetical protein RDABS01_012169 [Bienertia sinuspersici]
MVANFFWGKRDGKKGISWIAWRDVCKPKSQGGLGILTGEELNKLGLIRTCWKLRENDNLASSIIRDKYLSNRRSVNFDRGSHCWRSLGIGWELLKKSLRWEIGSGKNINFWNDWWIGPKPLRQMCSGPLQEEEENWTVAHVLNNDKQWSLNIPSTLILEIKNSERIGEDSLVSNWALEGGKMDSQSILKVLRGGEDREGDWDWLWRIKSHPKLSLFLWQLWWGRIACNENLAKRMATVNPHCCFCPSSIETPDHIFRHCIRATEV